ATRGCLLSLGRQRAAHGLEAHERCVLTAVRHAAPRPARIITTAIGIRLALSGGVVVDVVPGGNVVVLGTTDIVVEAVALGDVVVVEVVDVVVAGTVVDVVQVDEVVELV